jgi:hypothetical protein
MISEYLGQITKNIPMPPQDDIALEDFKRRLERLAEQLEGLAWTEDHTSAIKAAVEHSRLSA